MSEAVNNPYERKAPDKTLSVEGQAADAKAVGDALNKKNELILENSVDATTDSNGNIYTGILSSQCVILQAWSINALVSPFLNSSYEWVFHIWNIDTTNVGDGKNVTVWYRYYNR